MTLVGFLLARIAEDEAACRFLHAADCNMIEVSRVPWDGSSFTAGCDCGYPTRVLAECRAKRRMVVAYQMWDSGEGYSPDYWSAPVGLMLADLATPYADHPDYDPAWVEDSDLWHAELEAAGLT